MEVARTQRGLATCKEPPSCLLSSLSAMALQPAKSPPLAFYPPSLQDSKTIYTIHLPLPHPTIPMCMLRPLLGERAPLTTYTLCCRQYQSHTATQRPERAQCTKLRPMEGRKPLWKAAAGKPPFENESDFCGYLACPTGPLGALLIFDPPPMQCIPPNSRPLEVPGWTSGPPVPTPTETHRAALSSDNGHGCLKSHDTSSPVLGAHPPPPLALNPKPICSGTMSHW